MNTSFLKCLPYLKSSFSGKFGCVGVSVSKDKIVVTNTKAMDSFVIFTKKEWSAFIAGAKAGEFDSFGE